MNIITNDLKDATKEELVELIEQLGINVTVTDEMDEADIQEAIQREQVTTEKKDEILDRVFNNVTQLHQEISLNIYKIGQEFCEARKVLKYGEFMKWFNEKDFPFSYTTAYNFLRVYSACLDHPEAVQNIKKDILYKLASKTFPKELSEVIIQNSGAIIDISGKDLKKLRDDFVSGEIDMESDEIQSLFRYGSYTERKFQNDMEEDFLQLSKIETGINQLIENFNARCEEYTGYESEYKEKISGLFKEIKTDLENF